jgi:putative DNA primase/helicase
MDKEIKQNQLLEYLNLGWKIFPVHSIKDGMCTCGNLNCNSQGKHPITINGFKDASNDVNQILAWHDIYPKANWAVATGEISQIVVVDVDRDKGGAQSILNFEVPLTPKTITGGGGYHLFFNYPKINVKSSVRKIAPGIDIRGDGGYAILPPSNHLSGNSYYWVTSYNDAEFRELPEWTYIENQDPPRHAVENINGNRKELHFHEGRIIPEGIRNNTLTSVAGKLRRIGAKRDEIIDYLQWRNERFAQPPLEDKEIVRIGNSVARYEPQHTYELTEFGNAQRLIDLYGDRIKHIHPKKWMHFNGMFWDADDPAVHRYTKSTIEEIELEAHQMQEGKEKQDAEKWAKRSQRASMIREVLNIASKDEKVDTKEDAFDNDSCLLNFLNGTLDLRSGELRPHNSNDMITKIVRANYDPSADCPIWSSFLNRIMGNDQDLINYLQKAVGCALSGDYLEQVLFILYGTGANGKTTFLETIRSIFNEYSVQADFSTFLVTKGEKIRNDIARLASARIVIASEVGEGKKLDLVIAKQATGGEQISARFLYHEQFEFNPTFKIFLCANHKPEFNGADPAIQRRIKLIPFSVSIPEQEQDKGLLEKLKTEKEGIINWAVNGYWLWKKEGLDTPPAIRKATGDYLQEMNPIGKFLEDCCKKETGSKEKSTDLYNTYINWCLTSCEEPVSKKVFSKSIREAGFQFIRKSFGYQVGGIKLLEEGEFTFDNGHENVG